MESDSEASDIICTNKRRRQDNVESDSDLVEIAFPLRNRRRITSDDEQEVQNENRERNVSSQECMWKDTENITKVSGYSRISKINTLVGQNVTALQTTSGVLAEDFWKIIVTETNRYASQTLQNENRKLRKFENIWRDINIDEVHAYFALSILMSQVKKPTVQSYWSKRSVIETPIFRKIIPYWRFAQISRFLHFTDEEVTKIMNIVLEYNEDMGGVDLQDSYLSSFKLMKKYVKSCKKRFFHIADMALFNSYILYCKKMETTKCKKYSFSKFRIDVAEQILETVCLPDYQKRGRISAGNAPDRLQAKQWRHFPRNIPPTNAKKNPQRRCVVCVKHKKRSETTWECKKCLVALHIPNCFEKYHTLQYY